MVLLNFQILWPPAALPGGQTFEKFDKHVGHSATVLESLPIHPNPFVRIFKIRPPGRAAGGINQVRN
jgi:hypothetical protein